MAGETTITNYSPDLTAPPLSAPYRLDEGYSDETRSQVDKELVDLPSDDVMPLPDWLLANSEEDRAGALNFPASAVRVSGPPG